MVSEALRPIAPIPWPAVPPLIGQEEALALGEIEDHDEVEALVERAWRVRVRPKPRPDEAPTQELPAIVDVAERGD
jgi:hypothetical protein